MFSVWGNTEKNFVQNVRTDNINEGLFAAKITGTAFVYIILK